MTHTTKTRPLAAIAFFVLAISTLSAAAQETSGRSALLAAAEAAQELRALTAAVELSGEGGFKAYVPTGVGTIKLVRQAEPLDGRVWNSRLDTTYVHKQGDPEEQITALRTPGSFVWIDHEKKTVQERPQDENRSRASAAMNLFALPELTSPEPFSRELREGTSWKLLDRETVDGVACEVVEVTYDMSDNRASRDPSLSLIRTPTTKFYIGVEDRLPRRIERISNQSMISFSIVLDITDLDADPDITPADLAVATPEGYTRTAPARTTTPDPAVEPQTDMPRPHLEPVDEGAPDLPAHGFELVDGAGNEVTLDSLKGSVAVLYFWGTWCVPCRDFSPLVSNLVDTFEGEPVKVFGLPVRERSEEAVRDAISDYKHTLLLNPGGDPVGCDAVARAYKVRRYPTIYVIGFDSEVLAVKWPEPGVDAADTMAEVEQAIRRHLDSKD